MIQHNNKDDFSSIFLEKLYTFPDEHPILFYTAMQGTSLFLTVSLAYALEFEINSLAFIGVSSSLLLPFFIFDAFTD